MIIDIIEIRYVNIIYRFSITRFAAWVRGKNQLRVAIGGVRCPHAIIHSHPDLPSCAGCGRCCHLVVELRAGDVVPEELIVEHAGARCMDQRGNGACVALDPVTFLCTIYAARPQTCREFSRGASLCRKTLSKHVALLP